ncbi:MAG TPA: autotransporter-associated beta strand repeat-containing protein [Chthoniobacterales bacterium]|jgi:autotransporter-associated beta strand protein
MKTAILTPVSTSLLIFVSQLALGGSATWNLNPVSGDWNTAANWTPNTVPNGPSDVASFATSNIASISLSAGVAVDSIVFDPTANTYDITVSPAHPLTFTGVGVTNNSASLQGFVAQSGAAGGIGYLTFLGNTGAGRLTSYTAMGATDGMAGHGVIQFQDNSTAGNGTFVNQGGAVAFTFDAGSIFFIDNATAGAANLTNQGGTAELASGGQIYFYGQASAATATFVNNGGTGKGEGAGIVFLNSSTAGSSNLNNYGAAGNGSTQGVILFRDESSAGTATITDNEGAPGLIGGDIQFYGTSNAGAANVILNGGSVPGGFGGDLEFYDTSSAAEATITVNGGQAPGAIGGDLLFGLDSTGGNATLIVNGGSNGGTAGTILFGNSGTGGNCRMEVFDKGKVDFNQSGVTVNSFGSLEGSGTILLGATNLTIGGNNLSTTFSGLLRGNNGAITKTGTGTLTLSGMNSYGRTTVQSGTLLATNTEGSATGPGVVQVNGGTLGGSGIIAGAVTVGTGSGAGAILAPAAGSHTQTTLTTQGTLTLLADSTYKCSAKGRGHEALTDSVVANGVTITGAKFSFRPRIVGTLQAGTVFTVISNTSATPIGGNFTNLTDGAIVTVNGNKLQANYEGGDGNDLTLTVIPWHQLK